MAAQPALRQLRDDALTMLVLWATTQQYSADIEALLKQWSNTFDISDHDLNQRLSDATTGELQRPPDSRTGLQLAQQLQHEAVAAAAAAAAAGPVGGGGGHYAAGSKRPADERGTSGGGGGGGSSSAKRFKTIPAEIGTGDLPFANIGPAIGRKVLRYWPKDANRNKGDPWFTAVVTDYEEDTGTHILTYQFGTQKEEKERVSLAHKRPDELQLTDDVLDLLEWYADPKKRKRSSAVEKSSFLRKQYQALHGGTAPRYNKSGAKSSKAAHSNSALSSGYSL